MRFERHYFYSDDLDDLEHIESELLDKGIEAPQIHVLSRDNANVHRHEKLRSVSSFMKRDMIHSGMIGAIVGAGLGLTVLMVSSLSGWTHGSAGTMPFIFLALALFGAATWIGGLWGFQQPNHHFRRFQSALDSGRHVLFVDLDDVGRVSLNEVCAAHPGLESAGTGEAAPEWTVDLSNRTSKWWYWRMWKNA